MRNAGEMKDLTRELEEARDGAQILKALAHPVRLCIVRGLLQSGACNVTKMQLCLGIPQSTVSQHLSKLRDVGIVGARRHGIEVFYEVIHPTAIRVVEALFPETRTTS